MSYPSSKLHVAPPNPHAPAAYMEQGVPLSASSASSASSVYNQFLTNYLGNIGSGNAAVVAPAAGSSTGSSGLGPVVKAMEGLLNRNSNGTLIGGGGGGGNNTAIQQIIAAFSAGYNNAVSARLPSSPPPSSSKVAVDPSPDGGPADSASPSPSPTPSPSPSPTLAGVFESYLGSLRADLKNATSATGPLLTAVGDAYSAGYGSAKNSTKTLASALGEFAQSFLANVTASG